MNSERKQEPPSTLSLLDLIREALFRQGKSELVQRVVYVARVEPGNPMRKDLQSKCV
jgi:hypothetical protein